MIIMKNYTITIEPNTWGNVLRVTSNIGTFLVRRRSQLDYYGNPLYDIIPEGYIQTELPKVKGFRRNNNKQHYTTQSYNIEQTIECFIERLNDVISKGNKLYVNNF